MHFHLRVHHWVIDWIVVGVVCGIVVLVNLLFRRPAPDEVVLSLFFGGLYWVIGGIVCYCVEAVKLESPHGSERGEMAKRAAEAGEYHCASDFLFPGASHHLFPRRH
jgi:hypothetical protein